MGHPAAFALLLLMAAVLLGTGYALAVVWQRTGPARLGPPAAAPRGQLVTDDLGEWDAPTLTRLRDPGPPVRGLAAYMAAIDLQELQERCAETSEIKVVKAIVRGEDFRSGLDEWGRLVLERTYAELAIADIGTGLASVGGALA